MGERQRWPSLALPRDSLLTVGDAGRARAGTRGEAQGYPSCCVHSNEEGPGSKMPGLLLKF